MNNKCEKCAAYAGDGECRALICCAKENERCSFFKTPEQAEKDRRQAFVRILGMPKKKRAHIYKKYYGKEDPGNER